jgi:Putative addiction module component
MTMPTTVVEPDTDFDVSLLSQEQKLNLIERLWNAIEESAIPYHESHREIVRVRLLEVDENPRRSVSLEEYLRQRQPK